MGIVGFVQGFYEPLLKHDHLLTPGSEVLVISPPRARGINKHLPLKLRCSYVWQLKASDPWALPCRELDLVLISIESRGP